MLDMLFFGLRIYQDIVNEHHHKLVEVLHEYLIYEVHEISWGIGKSEGHHSVLEQTIACREGCLGDVRLTDLQLVVSGPQINLGEDSGSVQLVEQILDLGERILVLDGYFVQLTVVHTHAYGAVSLVHKENWRTPGSNQSLLEHVIQLLLQFNQLFGIHPVGSLCNWGCARH